MAWLGSRGALPGGIWRRCWGGGGCRKRRSRGGGWRRSKRSAWLSWIQALNQILQCLFVNLLAAFVCGFTVIRSIVSVRLVKILYEKRLIFIIPPRASRESLTRDRKSTRLNFSH